MSKIIVDTIEHSDGTVFNSSEFVKILDIDNISGVSSYHITSTYINSTYNNYLILAHFKPVSGGTYLYSDAFSGGVAVDSGNAYGRYVREVGSGSVWNSDNQDELVLYNYSTIGNSTGEGITVNAMLQQTNPTTIPVSITGTSTYLTNAGPIETANFGGSMGGGASSNVINGLNFYFNSGNISTGRIKLYGIK